jgi:uncharacterized protein (DUF2147 family)
MILETLSNQEPGLMKKTILRFAAVMAICGPFPTLAAEPIYGVWVRDGPPDDKLEFYDCKGKLCARGTLPLPDGSPAPEILRKAAKNGENSWKGDLFNPEDGKTYTGSITYDSTNKLTLSGCLMIFCQSETWTRVSFAKPKPKPAEAKSESTPEGAKAHDSEAGHGAASAHGAASGHGAAAGQHEAAGHETTGHTNHAPAHEAAPAHEGAAKETAPHHSSPGAAPKPKAPAPKPKSAPEPADEQ